jgi:L-ascorbate metabolism protein UlaG (beta-lactamase superfamily)
MPSGVADDALTWLGHSTVLVDLDGTRLLTDPVLRRRVAHLRRAAAAVPAAALAAIDAVLVSHSHLDHLDLPSLSLLDRSLRVVVPCGAGRLVRRRGFEHVVEVEEGEELELGTLRVHAVHAEHDSSRRPLGVRARPLGYVLRGSRIVYFAGDTDLFSRMRDLRPVDVALLPVGGWGPTIPAGHLDPERAAEALVLIRPEVAVPIHWGTFRTPLAPPPNDLAPRAFVRAAAAIAPRVRVQVLRIGESCAL